MKNSFTPIYLTVATTLLLLCGCASDDYRDDKEYSDIPWNTPQSWEGSRSIPGMTPNY